MEFNAEKIKKFLCENMGLSEAQAMSGGLFEQGYLDSLNMIDLVAWIEQAALVKFGVLDISLENLDSIDRIMKFVAKKRGKDAA
jgi:acyl carrier protein